MGSFDDIVNRIKLIKNLHHDYEVAGLLRLSKSAFAERKRRDSIPIDKLEIFCANESIDMNWLNTGKGWMYSPRDRDSAIRLFSNLLDKDVNRIVIVSSDDNVFTKSNCFIFEKGNDYYSIEGKYFRKQNSYSDTSEFRQEAYFKVLKLLLNRSIPVALVNKEISELKSADLSLLFNEIPTVEFHPSKLPFEEIIMSAPTSAFKDTKMEMEVPKEIAPSVLKITPIEALEVLAKHICDNDGTFNTLAEKHKLLLSKDYSVLNAFVQLYYAIQAFKGQVNQTMT